MNLYLHINKHVLQQWQWTVFPGRQTSTEWRYTNIISNILLKQNFLELKACQTKRPR